MPGFRLGLVRAILGASRPYLPTGEHLVQSMISRRHGAPSCLGVLAAFKQVLVDHFVEQETVIGDQDVVVFRHVEGDGPAAVATYPRSTARFRSNISTR
jgi:hypothetical protein